MENSEKIKAFEKELEFIANQKIRDFAILAIQTLPDYFFEIPASSTNKYHPAYALGEGGLVRHTRAAVRIAVELFRLDWWKFDPDSRDLILVSLILHDGWKSGIEKSKYTKADHPKIAKFALETNDDLRGYDLITNDQFEFITGNILVHMGQWNRDFKTGEELMPLPQTKYQKFVHLADYLASRKCLEMNFDVELSKE